MDVAVCLGGGPGIAASSTARLTAAAAAKSAARAAAPGARAGLRRRQAPAPSSAPRLEQLHANGTQPFEQRQS
ncbi:MAG: hypothetical protein N2688_06405, partial [Burkholderiaceae bacterium]|nr:hypothetical protein [Burkholderiaceae bacterium]